MSNFVLDETFMKLSKKMVVLGAFALVLSGASGLLLAKNNEKQPVQAATEDGYTVYRCDDLGFATRDSGDTRIVKGDSDGGMQTKGNVLSEKSELRFTFKKTLDNYWIGVGGYAVYVSSSTTVRFLYLSYNSSGQYSRGIEKNNLKMLTADGATDLATVDGGKLFTNYTDAVLRVDLSNPSAAKIEFYVEFNGVNYYPFDGSTKLGVVTYTNTASGFSSEDKYKAMAGASAADSGIAILKFQRHEKSLDDIITAGSCSFSYGNIDNFFFGLSLSEQIFNDSAYFNDHAQIDKFKNGDGNFIDIRNGLVINDQTFGYWIDLNPGTISYPRNDGVTAFPMHASTVFNPIAVEVTSSSLQFKIVTEYVPMEGMKIVFKAGIFEGYCNGITYVLSEDLTFYTTIVPEGGVGPARVQLTKTPTWQTTSLGYRRVDDWGEHTADNGGKYHKYLIWTDIPFGTGLIDPVCPADNYRYMYDNLLMNGLPLTHYHAWARGNSKDFTNLSDPSTQNPDYELPHPTGSPNPVYDLAIRLEVICDQPVYAFVFSVPNQLVDDLSLGTLTFSLRDGSCWASKVNGVTTILRYSAAAHADDVTALQSFANNQLHLADYDENLGYCNDNEHHYYLTAKQAYNALTDDQKVMFSSLPEFEAARARYETWATFNNDAAPYDGNNSVVTPINSASLSTIMQGSNAAIVVITVMAILSISAIGVALALKKKKQY